MKESAHTMTCKDLLGSLSEYVDGELGEDMCQAIERHIAACDHCRVVVDTVTRTIYLYQTDAQETELPEGVRERLFKTLKLDDLLKP